MKILQKISDIIYNLMVSIQIILNGLTTIVFQPIFSFLEIIAGIITQWGNSDETTDEEDGDDEQGTYHKPVVVKGFGQ